MKTKLYRVKGQLKLFEARHNDGKTKIRCDLVFRLDKTTRATNASDAQMIIENETVLNYSYARVEWITPPIVEEVI